MYICIMMELSKGEQGKRVREMGARCQACLEGDPKDPNGPLMGELDCLVEVMMLENLSADELVKKYGQQLWEW